MGKEEWRNTIKGFLQVVESREELCRKNIFLCVCLVTQSCPTLSNPADCSPSGSSVHGILQAGILEWVAMPPSRGSPLPKDGTTCLLHEQAGSLPLAPPGKTSNWLLLDQFDYMKGIDNIFREPFLRCLLFCYTEYIIHIYHTVILIIRHQPDPFFFFKIYFDTDHFKSLYWICYNIVSVLCFVFLLTMRHVGC